MAETKYDIVEGLGGLEDAIKQLEVETSHKALKNALMYASKPMLDDMKATTPYDPNDENEDRKHLRDYVKRKSDKPKHNSAASVRVGVISKAVAYIGYMLNFGTKHIAPRYWLDRAAKRNADDAILRFVKKAQKNMQKALK